jgi:hypothetical protein
MSRLPERSLSKAISRPSGDQSACWSRPVVVRRWDVPLSMSTT